MWIEIIQYAVDNGLYVMYNVLYIKKTSSIGDMP